MLSLGSAVKHVVCHRYAEADDPDPVPVFCVDLLSVVPCSGACGVLQTC